MTDLCTELQTRLGKVGFSFHCTEGAKPRHWWCWCGPHGRWDVEAGPYTRTLDATLLSAIDELGTYSRAPEG